jgi:ubiquinone/menaquinone biosynthesis C-methylase UbiE
MRNKDADFDRFAVSYRSIHTQNLRLSGETSEYFASFKAKWLCNRETGKTLDFLDFGCGDGVFAAALFEEIGDGCRYTGCDPSSKSIAEACSRDLSHACFVCCDGYPLPFASESFDIVFAACVFHHIADAEHMKALSELKRVLRPGGRIYIWEHNPFNPMTRRMVAACPFDQGCTLLRPRHLRCMLQVNEFLDITVMYQIFMPRHRLFRPFLRLENWMVHVPIGAQFVAAAIK